MHLLLELELTLENIPNKRKTTRALFRVFANLPYFYNVHKVADDMH